MQAQVDNEFNKVRYDYLIRLTLAQKTLGNTSKLSAYGGEKNNYRHNDADSERKSYLSYRDKIILISTQDDATHYWHPAKAALIKLGVTEPILKPFRGSFAFVGYAGVNKPSWIAQEQRARGQGPSVIHLRIPLQQSPPGK